MKLHVINESRKMTESRRHVGKDGRGDMASKERAGEYANENV